MEISLYKLISDLAKLGYYFPEQSQIEDIFIFNQLWGSTALGFNGAGGSSMTKAITTVLLLDNNTVLVAFGGRFAYQCQLDSSVFEFINKHRMPSQSEAIKLFKDYKSLTY